MPRALALWGGWPGQGCSGTLCRLVEVRSGDGAQAGCCCLLSPPSVWPAGGPQGAPNSGGARCRAGGVPVSHGGAAATALRSPGP